ncbi:MAG: histidine phosphatase family protein [Culicoidibacterales bacterium]
MKKTVMKLMAVICSFGLILGACSPAATAKKPGEVVFYVTRHGKTMLNTTDRVQGWSDAVLTGAGVVVVEQLAKGISDVDFVAAYSSDSGRAVETANIILKGNKNKKLELVIDARFREFNFGMYEGEYNEKMWTDIAKSQGKTLEEWKSGPISPKDFANSVAALDKPLNDKVNWPAEEYTTITARLEAGIRELAETTSKNGGGNVLLVSHGLSIAGLVDILTAGAKNGAGVKNASVTKITYKDGTWTVDEIGSLAYAEKGKAA